MNPEIKSLWLDALRSGEYVQGRSVLKSTVDGETRYCCLGVLTELAVQAGVATSHRPVWGEDRDEDGETGECMVESAVWYFTSDGMGSGSNTLLFRSVMEWSGLDTRTGWIPQKIFLPSTGEYIENLAAMNDSGEFTFEQIADVIEAQF